MSGTQKLIADSLRKNPGNLIIIEDAEEKLMSGKFAFAYVNIIRQSTSIIRLRDHCKNIYPI